MTQKLCGGVKFYAIFEFLRQFLQDAEIIFQKGVDNFETALKT